MTPRIALPVRCEDCYEELRAEVRTHDYETTIFVSSCAKCEQETVSDAQQDGYAIGKNDGLAEGWTACEEQYKDNIRAVVKLTQDVCDESKGGDAPTPS